MKKLVKKFLSIMPIGQLLIKYYGRLKLRFYYGWLKSREKLFTDFYKINQWSNGESASGPGSTLEYTENIRAEIPKLLKQLNISSILDAPCGDFNWFSRISDSLEINYIGGDIVEPIIKNNIQQFSNNLTKFVQLDVTKDKLPNADLWLCRDCLIHFSDKDIFSTLQNFFGSEINYLLTTTYTESKTNKNIPTGSHRFLNLELPPFNFCKPILYIDDWIEGHPIKRIGLWKREDLIGLLNNKYISNQFNPSH
jgi:hypothetical protein